MHHFSEWNDAEQPERITYKSRLRKNKYTIRIIPTDKRRAVLLEAALQKRHKPRDNKNMEFEHFSDNKLKSVIDQYDELGFIIDPSQMESAKHIKDNEIPF